MRTRTFLLAGLVVALLIAGVGSYYASGHSDGLERVAELLGFADRAQGSPTADGPFAGYSTTGVDDARLGGGLAGLAGSLVVLGLAFGLFRVLGRRDPADEPAENRS
jgi:cobalt/nickel transport system permease protein/cobalt/nickel transport protein